MCVLCAVLCVVSVCVLFIAYDVSYAVLVFRFADRKERARPKAELRIICAVKSCWVPVAEQL